MRIADPLRALALLLRGRLLDAALRALDARPAYVDELFERAQEHPALLNRVLTDAAAALEDPAFAAAVAGRLAARPPALEGTLVRTLDAASVDPAARAAIALAIAARSALVVRILTEDPAIEQVVLRAMIDQATIQHAARRAQ